VFATCRWGTDGQRPEQQPSSPHGGVNDDNLNNAEVQHVQLVSDDDEPAARSPVAVSPHAAGTAVGDAGGEADAEARKALAALSQKLSPAQFRAALRDFGAQVGTPCRAVGPFICFFPRDTCPLARPAELQTRTPPRHMPWRMRVTCG
jgi:hypothetical protein